MGCRSSGLTTRDEDCLRGVGKPAGPASGMCPSGYGPRGGVGWVRAECRWPFSVQDHRCFSHHPWWTCSVAPRGHGEPVEGSSVSSLFGAAASWRPFGAGPRGRMPFAGVCPLGGCCRSRPACRFGGRLVCRPVCSSGRSFFGAVGSAPHVLCRMCPLPSRVLFRGLGRAVYSVRVSRFIGPLFGAGSS